MFENCITGLPYADNPALIDALNKIIDEYQIDFVYPAHDSALLTLTQNESKLHARVVTSDLVTVEVCRNKNMTYVSLHDAYYCPKYYWTADEVDEYPVFAKPSEGQGSEGVVKINNAEEFNQLMKSETKYAVCEYLPGNEYTVDCFTDRRGNLRYIGQRTRERIRSGIAVRSRFIPTSYTVIDIANDLNKRFSFNGAWFFQVKGDYKGKLKLMEIAPRIAGTMGLSRNRGVNLPLLTIYNMLGQDVDIVNNYNDLVLDRAFISRFKSDIEYEKVYVDFDDTLIVRGEVNPYLIAFLYQAKDKGKKLVLLTKHDGDIYSRLNQYKIDIFLFDSIIIMRHDANKADYVCGSAIFIDDSFSERKKVFEACKIPVFDLDMVESLFDWKA